VREKSFGEDFFGQSLGIWVCVAITSGFQKQISPLLRVTRDVALLFLVGPMVDCSRLWSCPGGLSKSEGGGIRRETKLGIGRVVEVTLSIYCLRVGA
jgi:hypothetical protein